MYVLSDGTLTSSKKAYLQDALRFAFTVSSFSVPNSNIGVDIRSDVIDSSYELLFDNICKEIDSDISVKSMTTTINAIKLNLSYPYGNLEVTV